MGGNMEKLYESYDKGIYNKVYSQDNVLNLIKIKDNYLMHQQIEEKHGKVFMRMKKRDLMSCA